MEQKKAYIYASLVVLAWSTVATAFKFALEELSHVELLFWASLASTLVLAGSIILQKKVSVLFNFSRRQVLFCLTVGLLNPLLYYTLLFKAYGLLMAQEAQAINYTWAIILPFVAAVVLKQKLSRKDVITALVAYFGLYIIITHGKLLSLDFSSLQGILLAFASTLAWSFYWVLNTKMKSDSDCSLFLSFLISLPFSFSLCLMQEKEMSFSLGSLASAGYVGLFEMGLSFSLWNQALKLSKGAAKICQLAFLSPCLSFLILALVSGEEILNSSIVGLAIILTSLLVSKNWDHIRGLKLRFSH